MAISLVSTTTANTVSVTIPATTGGNCLVVCIASGSGSTSVSGITLGGAADNFGAVKSVLNAGGGVSAFIWADPSCAGGQTAVAISGSLLSVGAGSGGVTVYEVSGLATTLGALLDQFSTGTGTGNWSSGTTPTTTNATELWAGVICSFLGISGGPGAPWTNNSQGSFGMSGTQITSSTGTAVYSGTGTGAYAAVVVTLNSPAGQAAIDRLLNRGRMIQAHQDVTTHQQGSPAIGAFQ